MSVAYFSKAASAEGVDKHGTGSISAQLSAAPAKNIGIPYTNPKPDTCNPSVSCPRYCTKDSMVINKPSAITKFTKENPWISNGGSYTHAVIISSPDPCGSNLESTLA